MDVAHFSLVFGSVFLTFAVSGMCLFGVESRNFANLGRSLQTTMLALMGDFNYDELRLAGSLQAVVWFWAFTGLVQLIMLNMLLALILDVYMEVKGSVGKNAETLCTQTSEIHRRWRQKRRGQRIGLDKVLQALQPSFLADDVEDAESRLTAKDLENEVPKLGGEQASRIITGAMALTEDVAESGISMADAFKEIVNISEKVQTIHEGFMTHLTLQSHAAASRPTPRAFGLPSDKFDHQVFSQQASTGLPASEAGTFTPGTATPPLVGSRGVVSDWNAFIDTCEDEGLLRILASRALAAADRAATRDAEMYHV